MYLKENYMVSKPPPRRESPSFPLESRYKGSLSVLAMISLKETTITLSTGCPRPTHELSRYLLREKLAEHNMLLQSSYNDIQEEAFYPRGKGKKKMHDDSSALLNK